MAYRASRLLVEKKTADPGIVADMVRQFADRYAFLRELVQNGIDAGATKIDVRMERATDGQCVTSVEDDGSGMTRATIEGPLLTLFSSSKENDSSKIGKYGVGFVSVFAIEPLVVEVTTRNGAEAWLVRLFGDHSYELIDDRGRRGVPEKNGTTVALVQSLEGASFDAHAASAIEALRRWCRHARVPLVATVVDALDPAASRTVAINEPLGAAGTVSLTTTIGDETYAVGVGPIAGSPRTFCGFYNRGLTLYESDTSDLELDGVRFKVDSPRLSHTISRDAVKRDREHGRVMEEVRRLVRRQLHPALLARLERGAIDVADRAATDEYRDLLMAIDAMAFSFATVKDIVLPLLAPVSGASTMKLGALRPGPSGAILVADEVDAATEMLALDGHAVVHRVAAPAVLRHYRGRAAVLAPTDALSFAKGVEEKEPRDHDLASELATVLGRAGFKVAQVRLAKFFGLGSTQSFRVVGRSVEHAVTIASSAPAREWGRSATLFLNADDAGVRLARRRAKTDVSMAAQLLCRSLLITDGPLSPRVVDRLLEPAGG